jgi:23S rRNA (uracil1939-C5)-methyltransferase
MEMLIKNKVLVGTVTDQGKTGDGIVSEFALPIYVPNAIPGDVIEFKIIKVEKRRGFGLVLRVIDPSMNRVQPRCDVAAQCGGCQLQHQFSEAQALFKLNLLKQRLRRVVNLDDALVQPMLVGRTEWATRNKMQFSFGWCPQGLLIGMFAPRSHRVVNALWCHVMPAEMNAVLTAVRLWHARHPMPVFNEITGNGILRHLTIRFSFYTQQLMVILTVSRWVELPHFVEMLVKVSGMCSVFLSVQPDPTTDDVLGKKTRRLWGKPTIEDVVCGIRCQVSPTTFMQANAVLVEALYTVIGNVVVLNKPVIDLYCGAGVLTCVLAQHGVDVIGVDNNPSAIKDAKANAKRNQVRVRFYCMDVADYLGRSGCNCSTVIVDPPRRGMDRLVVNQLLAAKPERLVLVSCYPDTLARDLSLFLEGGYTLTLIQPVDMFCHTPHIECVVVLEA